MTNSKPLLSLSERYEVLDLLGEGGMGRVFRARDLTLERTVAIKVLFGQFAEMNVPRFQREAQLMSSLKHANLVEVYDFGITSDGDAFLVMENVVGQTLTSIVKRQAPMPVTAVLDLSKGIAAGMGHAHNKSVVHRDLKPSNILVADENEFSHLKILDFGISKALDTAKERDFLTMTGQLIGTPLYMSPEQAHGSTVDHRADIYSLGCIMYECLSGKPPFQGDTALDTIRMHRSVAPASLLEKFPELNIPPRLNALVIRLLSKSAGDRPATMQEVLAELDEIEAEIFTEAAPTKRGVDEAARAISSPAHEKQQKLLLGGIVVGLSVTFALAGAWLFINSTPADSSKPQIRVIPPPPPAVKSWEDRFIANKNRFGEYYDIKLADNQMLDQSGKEIPFSDLRPLTVDEVNLLKGQPVKYLRIEHSAMQPGALETIAELPEVEELIYLDSTVEKRDLTPIGRMRKLKKLDLRQIAVSVSDIRGWKGSKVSRLFMDKCTISDDALVAIVESLPGLQELAISSSSEDFTGATLSRLSNLKDLIYLDVAHSSISDDKLAQFSCPELNFIGLKGNNLVTVNGIKSMLSKNPKLKGFDVTECPLIYEAAVKSAFRSHPPELVGLNTDAPPPKMELQHLIPKEKRDRAIDAARDLI